MKLLLVRFLVSLILGSIYYSTAIDGYLSIIVYIAASTPIIHFIAKPSEDVRAIVWADGLFPGIALYTLVWIGLHQINL